MNITEQQISALIITLSLTLTRTLTLGHVTTKQWAWPKKWAWPNMQMSCQSTKWSTVIGWWPGTGDYILLLGPKYWECVTWLWLFRVQRCFVIHQIYEIFYLHSKFTFSDFIVSKMDGRAKVYKNGVVRRCTRFFVVTVICTVRHNVVRLPVNLPWLLCSCRVRFLTCRKVLVESRYFFLSCLYLAPLFGDPIWSPPPQWCSW